MDSNSFGKIEDLEDQLKKLNASAARVAAFKEMLGEMLNTFPDASMTAHSIGLEVDWNDKEVKLHENVNIIVEETIVATIDTYSFPIFDVTIFYIFVSDADESLSYHKLCGRFSGEICNR